SLPRHPPRAPLFPYTTLFRSIFFLRQDSKAWLFFLVSTVAFGFLTYMIVGGTRANIIIAFAIFLFIGIIRGWISLWMLVAAGVLDRKSTRLNSSHVKISYAVF